MWRLSAHMAQSGNAPKNQAELTYECEIGPDASRVENDKHNAGYCDDTRGDEEDDPQRTKWPATGRALPIHALTMSAGSSRRANGSSAAKRAG